MIFFLFRHLDISWAIIAESSHLHIATVRLEPETFGFRAQVANYSAALLLIANGLPAVM